MSYLNFCIGLFELRGTQSKQKFQNANFFANTGIRIRSSCSIDYVTSSVTKELLKLTGFRCGILNSLNHVVDVANCFVWYYILLKHYSQHNDATFI